MESALHTGAGEYALIDQDDKCTIILKSDGKISSRSGQRKKHIAYKGEIIFITERVAGSNTKIKHMHTKKMWTDVNTKPKQEMPYRMNWSLLMNFLWMSPIASNM